MKYSINIDQINSLAWDLNLSEAAVFTYLFNVPTWADPVLIDGQTFYFAARQKTCQNVPLISDKPDTIYRIYKSLHEKGVISYLKWMGKDCMRITEKGKGWNSEKNPSSFEELGKKSESTRKIFRKDSEKNPTYNSTIDNHTNDKFIEPQKEIEENDLLVESVKQVDGFIESTYEIIPSKQLDPTPPLPEAHPAPKVKKTKYIYPPTVEGLVPLFHAKLEEKKRVHVNITDTWNNANMQAEKFHLHHESKGWKIEKLNSAIALWVNNAITYGQVTKPCPVQYKGNPNTPQPATKLTYREEKPVFTQHDIEASEQFSSAAADVFKSLGVRV